MKPVFEKIWDLAFPYQDVRDDEGHAEVTRTYAEELLDVEDGDEGVVIPAIILHDTGWSQIPKDEMYAIFDAGATVEEKLDLRYRHQDASVEIGRGILNNVNYPQELTDEILEIVSQHDTREGFLSDNDGLTRDADKLWRFSKIGFGADLRRSKVQPISLYDKLIGRIGEEGFFYSGTATAIASVELAERKREFDK